MPQLPRLTSRIGLQDAFWVCNSCAKVGRPKSGPPPFFKSSMSRRIHNTTKPRQNVAPTFEELRRPFYKKNTSTMYYMFSIIFGTVALSYGSVPLYKMVRFLSPS